MLDSAISVLNNFNHVFFYSRPHSFFLRVSFKIDKSELLETTIIFINYLVRKKCLAEDSTGRCQ